MANPGYTLKYNPVPFIFEKGIYFHHLKALSFLEEMDDIQLLDMIEKVISCQNDDGSWAWLGRWEFPEKVPASITDTASILAALLDAGLDVNSEEVKKASSFLLENQRDDGGWSESPHLRRTMSESWTWFSVDHSVTWITGSVINALMKAGYPSDTPSIVRASGFLKKMQNREGGWPSHTGSKELETTDMWTMEEVVSALLAAGEKRDSKVVGNAEIAILKHRDRWKEPVENPLGVFFILGYGQGHRYVRECIGYLLENQKEDGGWGFYNDWPSTPDQAVRWLEVLLKYGVKVGQEDC